MEDLESSGRFLDSICWSNVGIIGLLRQVLAVDLGFFTGCFFSFHQFTRRADRGSDCNLGLVFNYITTNTSFYACISSGSLTNFALSCTQILWLLRLSL